jgi:hypothetical protein
VHALVTGNQLIRKSKSGHESSLFNPKDSAETTGEKDSLDGSKSNQTLSIAVWAIDPFDGPVGLLFHGGNVVDGLEKEGFLVVILHESINEDGVGLRVNIFHHHLEAVEAAGFGHLNFRAETLSQILKHNTVGGSEKRENVLDEVLLIWSEFEPVFGVLT